MFNLFRDHETIFRKNGKFRIKLYIIFCKIMTKRGIKKARNRAF
jgi:hypothetical protein